MHQKTHNPRYLATVLPRRPHLTMQVDAATFIDGFHQGFFMGFLASCLMASLFVGYWLVLRTNSVSQREVKSRAASAAN